MTYVIFKLVYSRYVIDVNFFFYVLVVYRGGEWVERGWGGGEKILRLRRGVLWIGWEIGFVVFVEIGLKLNCEVGVSKVWVVFVFWLVVSGFF